MGFCWIVLERALLTHNPPFKIKARPVAHFTFIHRKFTVSSYLPNPFKTTVSIPQMNRKIKFSQHWSKKFHKKTIIIRVKWFSYSIFIFLSVLVCTFCQSISISPMHGVIVVIDEIPRFYLIGKGRMIEWIFLENESDGVWLALGESFCAMCWFLTDALFVKAFNQKFKIRMQKLFSLTNLFHLAL